MNSAMTRAIALMLACCVPAATSAAPLALDGAARSRVDAVFKQYEAPDTPGCALGIFHNGAIVYARGYGMADLEHGVRITPASVFDVGSVSKQFAAAAMALLANDGKLSFSDDVRKYIPELPVYGSPITLNELMWHTSGLRDYTDLLDLAGYGLEEATTQEDALASVIRQRALEFASGSHFEYSNTNYFLLSIIVQRVTGKTLAQFVRQRIFTPLGMTHTLYRTDYEMLIPNRAMGYAPTPHGFKNSMSNWQQIGDGAVQISIDDALKWDENFYTARVGGRRMVDALQTPGHLANGKRLQYARGEFVDTYRGIRRVQHGGAWIGYRAAFDRYPDFHTSVVVLCNSDAAEAEALADNVAGVILQPYLLRERVTRMASAAKSSVPARFLTGSYFGTKSSSVFHIVAQHGAVALQAGAASYPLTPVGGSSFRLGTTPVTFMLGKDGFATAMRIGSGDESQIARKFTAVVPSAAQLQGASGTYYSPELDVRWQLRAGASRLSLVQSRFMPDGVGGPLQPQLPDTFTSDAGGFTIRLTRDTGGSVTGFTLSAGRGLRSLAFTRER